MDDVFCIVNQFRGTSLTKSVMDELKYTQRVRHFDKLKVSGHLLFEVEVGCTCSDKCGGLFCEADVTYTLKGLVDYELDLELEKLGLPLGRILQL